MFVLYVLVSGCIVSVYRVCYVLSVFGILCVLVSLSVCFKWFFFLCLVRVFGYGWMLGRESLGFGDRG